MSAATATATTMQSRIDALQKNGTFSFPPSGPPPPFLDKSETPTATFMFGQQHSQKKRERDDSAVVDYKSKYARSKEQMATLDRTFRKFVEDSEKIEIDLVKMTQKHEALLSENERLKEKVNELYQTITQLSKAAAQDRENAVAQALAAAARLNKRE